MNIFLAVILGLLFGFVLQKAGAANPQKIINMLRLKDLHLMKSILLGIGVSSLMLFLLLSIGIIDSSHLSVKSSYVGVIVGGGVLGIGWAIAGFCPGTGIVAAGAKRKDALSFITGGLIGAFVYMLFYESLLGMFLFDKLGGNATLAITGNEEFSVLLPNFPGILVAGIIAVILIVIAWKLPSKEQK
ncbi:MAG: YeeE/YedE thiosulfate transporter family protein [Candidatus Endonucleobacter bathymodioli]|uniref:YeeE/YedE thiosulfate transporter family protein n=1 Tax=Candidatus Endonucleibacter bathymodioli TaxID=539814 RepID=A0AA90NM27_9GAMM|nr:YeeE/YedE thiosulfate transporter family protein [Candidatus Endonucleobacter bathymodioli]